MIFVTHVIPVNEPGEPRLDRATVWEGLVLKANNALPFVPIMTECKVVERLGDDRFDRDICIRDDAFRERVTLEKPYRVLFTRLSGPILGTIANEIEGEGDDMQLRFSFALVLAGTPGNSEAEETYAKTMTGDYIQALTATRNAMRRIAVDNAA
ncbi:MULTISPECIES: SRPBCC family protein [Streptomyces]|uniref:SRPBCC family protein n=1 Tax=Streptomyces lycopersici TaxID=2974589 RepID=UPI0021D23943|nr:SRPBCC family protein [Streptomyces sp. NEAU-383]